MGNSRIDIKRDVVDIRSSPRNAVEKGKKFMCLDVPVVEEPMGEADINTGWRARQIQIEQLCGYWARSAGRHDSLTVYIWTRLAVEVA